MESHAKTLSVAKELFVFLRRLGPIPVRRIKQRTNVETAAIDYIPAEATLKTQKLAHRVTFQLG
jgi:hypothetical protein